MLRHLLWSCLLIALLAVTSGCDRDGDRGVAPLIPMQDFFRHSEESAYSMSPDGEHLLLAHAPTAGVFSVQTLNLESGSRHLVVQPESGTWGDVLPRYSSEGDRIAFVRFRLSGRHVPCVMPADGDSSTIFWLRR